MKIKIKFFMRKLTKENCPHKRIRKNYPFGRKSKAQKYCKTCKSLITNKMLEKRRKQRTKLRI